MQQQSDVTGRLAQHGDVDRSVFDCQARTRQGHVGLADRAGTGACRVNERKERRICSDMLAERLRDQLSAAEAHQHFGRRVDTADTVAGIKRNDREWQCFKQRQGIGHQRQIARPRRQSQLWDDGSWHSAVHAAACCSSCGS